MKHYKTHKRLNIFDQILLREQSKYREPSSNQIKSSLEKTKKIVSTETGSKKYKIDLEGFKKLETTQIHKPKLCTKRNTTINHSNQSEFEISENKNYKKEDGSILINKIKTTQKNIEPQLKLFEKKFFTSRQRNLHLKDKFTQQDERKISPQSKSPRSNIILKSPALEQDPSKSRIQIRKSVEKKKEEIVECEQSKKKQYSRELMSEKKQLSKVMINRYNLSQKQYNLFGDRFPQKFQKIKLLGRGGFSLVWLGAHRKSRQLLAVKQIITKNNHQTHLKQIWLGNFFFQSGGSPRQEFIYNSGINNLVKMISYSIQPIDTWIFYQLCDQTLGSTLYQLQAETKNDNKIYRMKYFPLYQQFIKNPCEIKNLIIAISKALSLLADHNIVHSDLKTQNILIKKISSTQFEYKLTDYGSSFLFSNLKQFSMATPQYMAPEILNFILFQNEMPYDIQMLTIIKNYTNQSAIDIWSLGCIILEIIHGIPLWMTIKTIIDSNNKQIEGYGLFAVNGRLFDKIIQKQLSTIQNIEKILDHENHSGIKVDEQLRYLVRRMMEIDPQKRIKPKQILQYLHVKINFDKNYFGL